MIWRIVIGAVAGGVVGAVMGYVGKCASGTCPLTSHPVRGALFGAVLGVLIALSGSGTAKP